MKPRFFASAAAFRKWLSTNHDKATELSVGFYNAASGKGGLSYKEAVDEALCFGWIDGVRRNIDAWSYSNRFSPRKPKSKWSLINIARAKELIALGKMAKPGMDAFEKHTQPIGIQYSYENRGKYELSPEFQKKFESKKRAWKFFTEQAPWYRRVMVFWVMSAKKEETRKSRFEKLLKFSAEGKRL